MLKVENKIKKNKCFTMKTNEKDGIKTDEKNIYIQTLNERK